MAVALATEDCIRSRLEALRAEMARELNGAHSRCACRTASRDRRLARARAELERLCCPGRGRLLPDRVQKAEACRRLRETEHGQPVRVRQSLDRGALRRAVGEGELSRGGPGRVGVELSGAEGRSHCALAGDGRGGR